MFLLLLLLALVNSVATVAEESYEETSPLTDEDFYNARLLNTDDLYLSQKPRLDKQNNYRGDIRGKAAWSLKKRHGVRRNGVRHQNKKWPNGRIPYVLSNQYNNRERSLLARAFDEYHRRTCVRFTPKQHHDYDYLYIGKIDGCYSDVGRAGGRQELSLDDGCLEYDTAVHELMHAVGFYHEHERWDRDDFIQILWQNIDREAYDQFGRVDLSDISYYNQGYDYYSIMHYDSVAFSKNGGSTMLARQHHMTPVIGNAKDFSTADLSKINSMYNCGRSAGTQWTGGAGGGRGQAVANVRPTWNKPAVPVPTTPPPQPVNTPSSCVDKTNLCWKWAPRCRSYFFERLMKEYCPRTCGHCNRYAEPRHYYYSNDAVNYYGKK